MIQPSVLREGAGRGSQSRRRVRLGLAGRIALGLGCATVAIFVVVALVVSQAITQVAEARHGEMTSLLVRTLQEDLGTSGTFDVAHMQQHLDALRQANSEVVRINIYRAEAGGPRVVASTDHSLIGRLAESHDVSSVAGQQLSHTRALETGERVTEVNTALVTRVGPPMYLGLYLSRATLEAQLEQTLGAVKAFGLVSLLVLLGLHGLVWRWLVGGPLALLTQACYVLTQGNYGHRLPTLVQPGAADELDVLAKAFNAMAQTIQEQQRELQEQATHDHLTGLLNQRALLRRLDEEVARAARYGAPLSLLVMDMDGFKRINDDHGHLAGDEVLQRFAQEVLLPSVRGTDAVARYGGDEFVVLMPHTAADGSAEVCRRVAARAAQPLELPSGLRVALSVSCGSASFPQDAVSADGLLQAADASMYEAKKARKVGRQGRTVRSAPESSEQTAL